MRTLVTASAHFAQTPDGHLWTPNASLEYPFWTRYLDAYDDVLLMAQAAPHDEPPSNWKQATGPHVAAATVPDFLTPRLFVSNYACVKRFVKQTLDENCAVHLRVSCFLGDVVWRAMQAGRPYGVEAVADPYDSFAPGAYKHPLRPLLRSSMARSLKAQCAGATAAAYVTREALQRRYPPAQDAFTTNFSSINLRDSDFVSEPRESKPEQRAFSLVTVGTLAQLYKAPDILIEAVAQCVKDGLDLNLTFVGDGQYRAQIEAQTRSLGIADRVHFRGQLTDKMEVQKELDAADLYVMPSRQEGLPRAMIEAMARALPCIGSTVGGIPELLRSDEMVPPNDVTALAEKIREVLCDRQRMAALSKRNLEIAREYEEEVLRARRVEFYRYVREKTALWLKR